MWIVEQLNAGRNECQKDGYDVGMVQVRVRYAPGSRGDWDERHD
jgi:hypothetical protein